MAKPAISRDAQEVLTIYLLTVAQHFRAYIKTHDLTEEAETVAVDFIDILDAIHSELLG